MTRQEIERRIRAILVEKFEVAEAAVRPQATFVGDFQLESLAIVDFITVLHKAFRYRAAMESYRGIETFEQLVDHVERKLAEKGA